MFRSSWALAFGLAAAALFAVADVLLVAGYASLGGYGALATFRDLTVANAWLDFLGSLSLLVGTVRPSWAGVVQRQWTAVWEAAALALGALLFTVGSLVRALTALGPVQPGYVVAAVGIGVWAVVALVSGARWALVEQDGGAPRGHVPPWLISSVGLVIVAVGIGLPPGSVPDKWTAVADAIVLAVGFGVLAAGVAAALAGGLLRRQALWVVGGFGVLAAGEIASAAVDGTVFGQAPGLTGLRVGLSLAAFITMAGFALLAGAAWVRLRVLAPHGRRSDQDAAVPAQSGPQWVPAAPPWWGPSPPRCGSCASVLVPTGRFCAYCGLPVTVGSGPAR